MKKTYLYLLLVLFVMVSCKKDSPQTSEFRFTVSNNYIAEKYQIWIVVSDNTKVYFSKRIENGQTYVVDNITAKLVDVHFFRYYESLPYQYLTINTFNDVTPDEWYLNRQYPLNSVGTITVTINDLEDIKNWTVATPRGYSSSATITPKTLAVHEYPLNVLISYLPSDNSPMKYKYVQDILQYQSLEYLMSDFQQATGLISYDLPIFNYFAYGFYGYNNNPNTAKYRLSSTYYTNSSISSFNFNYPNDLYLNYYSYFYFEDNADNTRAMHSIKYGALPTVLPTVSYVDIDLTNENIMSEVTASIANPQNYQEFYFNYFKYEDSKVVDWYIYSKPSTTISHSLPDIPNDIKQKSTYFTKNNLEFWSAELYKFIDGQANSWEEYINMCIKPSIYFNEVITKYEIYYRNPAIKKKKIGLKSATTFEGENQHPNILEYPEQ